MPRFKKRRSDAVFSTEKIRAAHVLYQKGYSVRQLADCYGETWGFKSAESAATSLYHAFKADNLPLRDYRHAAQVRDRDKPRQETLWRDEPNLGAGFCQGRVVNYPRRGAPCQRRVKQGERYCGQHDPSRAEERKQRLATAREARAA